MKINKIGAAYSIYKNRKSLISMLKAVKGGEYKMGAITYISGLMTIAYMIWPMDILPDFVPGLGWLDDTAAFLLLVKQLKIELKKYNESSLSKPNINLRK